ncbi:hypothetical protein OG897_30120 [Streptomyces sp. NBC_00237]|uniref:hypothetical protein n=1 Tax=Streptomyces sp. NBC_00237 TaxID=2975687 RepID=UPI00224DEEEC|nr:hypothetical protein [Streptomyces sp. NBC_00237]MCX5205697.1 hypothetical protein [Streptomyces sp. NBC_00237]
MAGASVESAVWRDGAAFVFTRPDTLRLYLNPDIGRALATLPAEVVLVTAITADEFSPLLPAFGWEQVYPVVLLKYTRNIYYIRLDDLGGPFNQHADIDLSWLADDLLGWAHTHDKPIAWIRPGEHLAKGVKRLAYYSTTPGPLLTYGVHPAVGLTADDLREQCPTCHCCLECVSCHCHEWTRRPLRLLACGSDSPTGKSGRSVESGERSKPGAGVPYGTKRRRPGSVRNRSIGEGAAGLRAWPRAKGIWVLAFMGRVENGLPVLELTA